MHWHYIYRKMEKKPRRVDEVHKTFLQPELLFMSTFSIHSFSKCLIFCYSIFYNCVFYEGHVFGAPLSTNLESLPITNYFYTLFYVIYNEISSIIFMLIDYMLYSV